MFEAPAPLRLSRRDATTGQPARAEPPTETVYTHVFSDGYGVELAINWGHGWAKLRDAGEVLTVPKARRREYAEWLRDVAEKLEAG